MGKGWFGVFAEEALGLLFALYLWLVRRTNRFIREPADIDSAIAGQTPVIVAMWHGQHLMISYAWPKSIARMAALISRHRDAGAQAVALRHLGVTPVRGSGGRSHRIRDKGGASATLSLRRLLGSGVSVAMMADVPKRARLAGRGIVMLARISGRPIVPTAVVTSRRFDFNSWDRASLGKPFGRGAIVAGRPDPRAPRRRRRGDGGRAAEGRGRARRRPPPRLCAGRRARSRRRPQVGDALGSEADMILPLSLGGYRLATRLATPLAGPLLSLRLNRGKEDALRLEERRGEAGQSRPGGPLVWLHGASVGEALSLLPLVERLTQGGRGALVTTGTVTSARLLERRLPAGAFHQFAPLDAPGFMRRFFAHWRPELGLIAESELWPNMIVEANRAEVPLVMVNARMSARSFERWGYAPAFIRALLSRIDLSLAQTPGDAERLAALGARAVQVMGNMKFDAAAPPADRQELATLAGLTSGRQIWIAASTHEGEERIAAEAHRKLEAVFPDA